MFSKFFIDRPIFASVLSIVLVIVGLIAMRALPVQEYPNIAPPQVMVDAVYPGADAQTLAATVIAPIEEELNGVKDMIYITSTTSPNGAASINVFFKIGADVNKATVDVNNRVQLATNKLPDMVKRLGISVRERSPDILRVIALTSKDGVHDTTFVSNYALVNIIDDLKRIPGVGDATIFGNKNYSMRVWIQPDKLSTYALSTTEIIGAIRNQNEQFATGQIAQEPITKNAAFTYTVQTDGRLKSVQQFEQIIIRSNADGSALRLKDVARVELGTETYNFNAMLNKEPMIPIGIFLASGANAMDVSGLVEKKLEEIKKNAPEDITITTVFNPTEFIAESIHEVVFTLALAIVLVIGVMYLFLGNFKATLIPTIAIPISLIGTFAGFYAMGFSINLLTLFGLTLAIGLVVDDAIIVVENVERLLKTRDDLSVKEATVEAMREITGPIVAIVLVIGAVFIPAAMTEGFSGTLYKQFAITIVISITISGIVALTFTPALCATLLKKHESEPFWLIRKFNQFFDWSTFIFSEGVKRIIRFSFLNVLLFAIMLGAIYSINAKLPTSLVPNEDKGAIMVFTNLMPGASLSRTMDVSRAMTDMAKTHPLVTNVGALSGMDMATNAFKTDAGVAFLRLKDWSERPGEGNTSQAIAGHMMRLFSQNKEALQFALTPPPIMGLSTTGGFDMYIQDRTGGDIHTLNRYTQEIITKAQQRKELTAVRTTLNTNVPQYKIKIDTDKAKSLGIENSDIYATIQATFGSTYVNDYNLFGRTYRVNVQSESAYREGTEDYSQVFVRSNLGELVPVSSIATLERIVGPAIIQRFNLFTSSQISGQPSMGYSSGEAMKAIEEVAKEVLPSGYTIAWAGTSFQEKALEQQANFALVYAVLFVFLILAALYESWSIPLSILMCIPFAMIGAVGSVFLRGYANDIYFQVGLVTLVGLSAKNAILLVEFAIYKIEEGYNLLDATIEAAKIRFRPIVMTSFAFIAGTLPLAISTGAGANSRHVIGTTIVGGMITLTVVGTFFIPLFFYIIMRIKEKFTKKDTKKVSHEA